MEEMIFALAFIAVVLFTLTIGGLIADYILPRIKRLNSYIDNLPMMNEEEHE